MGSVSRELRLKREREEADQISSQEQLPATGASQTIASENDKRLELVAQALSATWWINPAGGVASVGAANCFELTSGSPWKSKVVGRVTGIATNGTLLAVEEWVRRA